MEKNSPKFIWGSVLTYNDLRNDTDYVLSVFKIAIDEFTSEEIKPRYYSATFINGNTKLYKYSDLNYIKIKDLLNEDKLQSLTLDISKQEYTGPSGIPDFDCIQISIIICSKQIAEEKGKFRNNANEVAFSVSSNIYSNKMTFLKKWIKEIFIETNGINGFIEYLPNVRLSGVIRSTPYNELRKYKPNYYGNHVEKLRGYYWLNILTDIHINTLGGIEYVKKNLPHYKIDKITLNNGKSAYICQLSENIYDFNKKKYLKLKNVLRPILDEEDIKKAAVIRSSLSYFDDRRLVFNELQLKQLEQLAIRNVLEIMQEMTAEDEAAEKREIKLKFNNVHENVEWKLEDNIEYNCLCIQVGFSDINNEASKILSRIFEAWYDVGVFGGFDGLMHDASGLTRIDNDFSMFVDLGSADTKKALYILEKMINKFAKDESLKITKMVLGNNE